jgi:gp16 family phage-associated protein
MATVEQVRNAFRDHGVCIAEWARERGFNPRQVHDVLLGRAKGRRGEAHRIAMALGLKGTGTGSDPRGWGRNDNDEREGVNLMPDS